MFGFVPLRESRNTVCKLSPVHDQVWVSADNIFKDFKDPLFKTTVTER